MVLNKVTLLCKSLCFHCVQDNSAAALWHNRPVSKELERKDGRVVERRGLSSLCPITGLCSDVVRLYVNNRVFVVSPDFRTLEVKLAFPRRNGTCLQGQQTENYWVTICFTVCLMLYRTCFRNGVMNELLNTYAKQQRTVTRLLGIIWNWICVLRIKGNLLN
jgi:hypothetical protein